MVYKWGYKIVLEAPHMRDGAWKAYMLSSKQVHKLTSMALIQSWRMTSSSPKCEHTWLQRKCGRLQDIDLHELPYLNLMEIKLTTYCRSVHDNRPLKGGHCTWFWCSQDKVQKKPLKLSENPTAKCCNNVGMKCYSCRSAMSVKYKWNKNAS